MKFKKKIPIRTKIAPIFRNLGKNHQKMSSCGDKLTCQLTTFKCI